MNKAFKNRYGTPYTNQSCKESAWDKVCKTIRCYSGWGKTKEDKHRFRGVQITLPHKWLF